MVGVNGLAKLAMEQPQEGVNAKEREWFLHNFGVWVQPFRIASSNTTGWLVVKRLRDLGAEGTREHASFTTAPQVEVIWEAMVEVAMRRKQLELL